MQYRGGHVHFEIRAPANDNVCVVHWLDTSSSARAALVVDLTEFQFKSGPIWSPACLWQSGPDVRDLPSLQAQHATPAVAIPLEWRPAALVFDLDDKRASGPKYSGTGLRESSLGAVLFGLGASIPHFGDGALEGKALAPNTVTSAGGSNAEQARPGLAASLAVADATPEVLNVVASSLDVNAKAIDDLLATEDSAVGGVRGEADGAAGDATDVRAGGSAIADFETWLDAASSTSVELPGVPTGYVVQGGDDADRLTGGAGNDVLIGGDGDDTLLGGGGDDLLDGGRGSDVMHGGAGNDTFLVDNAGDEVIEDDDPGTDTVIIQSESLRSYSLLAQLRVENLELRGNADFAGAGNDLANVITGGAGNDTLDGAGGDDRLRGRDGNDHLDGGGGADTLEGGRGNDVYVVDDADDEVVEVVDGGFDTIETDQATYQLGDEVENLIYTGSDRFIGRGNDSGNEIAGGEHDDRLFGDRDHNDDHDEGGEAKDLVESALTILLGAPQDVIELHDGGASESGGFDRSSTTPTTGFDDVVIGSRKNDTVIDRLGGNDTIDGGKGNDTIDGGAGDDVLIGGDGNDTFIFRPGFGNDVITDFGNDGGNHDTIYLYGTPFDDVDFLDTHVEQVGDDVVIDVSPTDHITMHGFEKMNLSLHDHFVFI